MRIIADQEATDLVSQMADALLKKYGTQGLALANTVLGKIEDIDTFVIKKLEEKTIKEKKK